VKTDKGIIFDACTISVELSSMLLKKIGDAVNDRDKTIAMLRNLSVHCLQRQYELNEKEISRPVLYLRALRYLKNEHNIEIL